MSSRWYGWWVGVGLLLLTSCTKPDDEFYVSNPSNACLILQENSDWVVVLRQVRKKWGVDGAMILAFVNQESSFNAHAVPNSDWFTTINTPKAYGFAQAIQTTWEEYKFKNNAHTAHRYEFADSVDFMGWYINEVHKSLKISKTDSYRQYLVYHEGRTGYLRRDYRNKDFLLKAARKVSTNYSRYKQQIKACGYKGVL